MRYYPGSLGLRAAVVATVQLKWRKLKIPQPFLKEFASDVDVAGNQISKSLSQVVQVTFAVEQL